MHRPDPTDDLSQNAADASPSPTAGDRPSQQKPAGGLTQTGKKLPKHVAIATPRDLDAATSDLPFVPLCCDPRAFTLMHEQTLPPTGDSAKPRQLDTDEGLTAAVAAVAAHAMDDVSVRQVEQEIEDLATAVRDSMPMNVSGRAPSEQAKLAHLHQILFDDYGFRGTGVDYYDPRSSFLPSVLKTRRGLPITLALIYKLVAGRLGLKCWGVGLPGHFVAGVDCHGPMLVDCFHGGRILDREDAEERVRACCGDEADFRDEMLRPVTHRHWVTRLIQNLLQTYTTAGQYSDVAAMLEFELVLWPDQLHLQRDLGLVLARLGQSAAARRWINEYLLQRPDDPQRPDLEELLGVLN